MAVNFMDLAKRKSLMKAFITSQFNYCPLIWMFYSRQLNNPIKKIQERAFPTNTQRVFYVETTSFPRRFNRGYTWYIFCVKTSIQR